MIEELEWLGKELEENAEEVKTLEQSISELDAVLLEQELQLALLVIRLWETPEQQQKVEGGR